MSDPAGSSSDAKPPRQLLPRSPGKGKAPKIPKRLRNPTSGCYVPICPRKNCTLPSHHHPAWGPTRSRTNSVSLPGHKLVVVPDFADPTINDDEFKNLFHQYLTFDMPRILALMAPPPLIQTPEDDRRAKIQNIANLGLLAPVYFLLFASMAHILELVRREELEPDRVSAKLYGRLMRVVREKLSNYKPSEASDLVLAVLALSSFDMTLRNHAAVEHHRMALQGLVSQAGIPHLGRSMAYVFSWDRLMAAFTAKPPLYAKMPDRRMLRSPHHPLRYGLGFDMHHDRLNLDVDVRNLCSDVCRAIEIVEAENWTFRPERLNTPYTAEVQYLYFLRDVIQNTCIILQARDLSNSPTSRPIFFAAMIVQYLVLGINELPWYSSCVADRLYAVLAEQNIDEVWKGCEDVFCWLMCLLIIVPKPWNGQQKAVKLLKGWVENQSRNMDVSTQSGLCNPEDFLWYKPEFDDKLSICLKEIRTEESLRLCQIRRSSFGVSDAIMLSWAPESGDFNGAVE